MIRILLYEVRASKGLKLKDLEKLSGVGHSTISYIENGKKSPTLRTLEKLAKSLDCEIKDLFEEY